MQPKILQESVTLCNHVFYYLFVDLCWLIGEYNSELHIFRKCESNKYKIIYLFL